jgi:hypothetical protein
MKTPLTLHIAGVAVLVTASLAAIADQSEKFVGAQEIIGVHELPAFVSDHVELTPGLSVDSSAPAQIAATSDGRRTPVDLSARTDTGES